MRKTMKAKEREYYTLDEKMGQTYIHYEQRIPYPRETTNSHRQ